MTPSRPTRDSRRSPSPPKARRCASSSKFARSNRADRVSNPSTVRRSPDKKRGTAVTPPPSFYLRYALFPGSPQPVAGLRQAPVAAGQHRPADRMNRLRVPAQIERDGCRVHDLDAGGHRHADVEVDVRTERDRVL